MRSLGFAGSQRSWKHLISTGAFVYDSKDSIECICIPTEEEKLAFFSPSLCMTLAQCVFPALRFVKFLTDNYLTYLTSTNRQSASFEVCEKRFFRMLSSQSWQKQIFVPNFHQFDKAPIISWKSTKIGIGYVFINVDRCLNIVCKLHQGSRLLSHSITY